jgi:ketosteroid isomerase-like protein
VSAPGVGPVRSAFEAFERGDMEGMLRHVDPEFELFDPERAGEGPFRGHEGFRSWTKEWLESWDAYDLELEGLVVVGDRVGALVHHRASASGIELDQRGAQLHRVRDELIVSYRPYTDAVEALEAAGLPDAAMWRTAIDTLRVGYEAWSQREYDALVALLPPRFEFVPVLESPDMPAFSGMEGIERFWESMLATWESFVFTPLSYELRGGQILVEVRVNAKASASGIELEEHWAHVYTLHEGEFVRLQAFLSRDEALGALLS